MRLESSKVTLVHDVRSNKVFSAKGYYDPHLVLRRFVTIYDAGSYLFVRAVDIDPTLADIVVELPKNWKLV
jgi:hypothetical protein